MTYRMLVVLISVLASYHYASSQTLELTEERIEVKGRMRHLRDGSGAMQWPEIQKGDFEPIQQDESLNFGFDMAPHWFAFDIVNHTQEHDWLMEIAFAPLDIIDLYVVRKKTDSVIHRTGGDAFPISYRDIRHQHPNFNIILLPGEHYSLYVRVKTSSSVQLPVILWSKQAFYQRSFRQYIINGLFYGAMMIMALYQLFLWITIRDRITFYYVSTLVMMVNIVAFFQGYSFLYLYPDHPKINVFLAITIGPIFLFFSTILTRAFLQLRRISKLLDTLLIANMILDFLAAILMVVLKEKISYGYHHYLILSHSVITLICAAYCAYRKYRPALYYLISWITLLFATVMFTMSNIGLFPAYIGTTYTGLMVGCVLQMLFIAFALGDRWNILIRQNHQSKELELKRREEEKEKLEREVKLRIEEIELKTEKLEEVNRIKDKLFSIVSHDIKGPLSSLQIALSLTKNGAITKEEFQQLTGLLDQRFYQTTKFIENLLQWANLQLKGISFEPTCIDVRELAKETFDLMDFDIRSKGVSMENTIPEETFVYADLNMIRSVFRNLITNALKFSNKGGVVRLHATRKDNTVIISVADNGVGIPLAHRSRLFTLESVTTEGTKKEKGTGLGLLLCKEFIEKNGGNIWFESEEGKGTTFYFTLPLFQKEHALTS